MDKMYWSENMKGKDHFRNLGEDGKITLKWTITEKGMRVWIKFNWLATVLRACLRCSKTSGKTER
jgi:hypothetical protein